MADFEIKKNDSLPDLEVTLFDEDGRVDLTGATVQFHMQDSSGSLKINSAAVIDDATAGEVRYNWDSTAGDTDTAGDFEGEFEVDFGSNDIQTWPHDENIEIKIIDDVN